MKILLTNDDGVQAEGLRVLFKELRRFHDVLVLAPDREQSATGHSLTLSRPLRIYKHGPAFYSCDGTPTDSVLLAVLKIMNHKYPDMIISGINHGPNMGEDIMYSGTVAAAIEGSLIGIPSMAVSMVNSVGADFIGAARFIRRLIRVYPSLDIHPSTILNINLPGKVTDGFKKFRFTFLGSRKYDDIIIKKTDPRGQDYYWIAGSPVWEKQPGSDINAIRAGAVSITPVNLHFTDGPALERLLAMTVKLPR
ncbi:MAG: 5'/3'-nucleotidase SurE [candidate division Zixibacteria bacterium]|nr:5'/3'-nucleotidase SurE [candidate division Zixibacteria bacterium]